MRTVFSAVLVLVGFTLMAWPRCGAAATLPAATQSAATEPAATQPATTQPAATLPHGPTLSVKLTPLGRVPNSGLGSVRGNAESGHVAYREPENNPSRVFVDGVPGPMYDWILPDSLALSLDGKHVGYTIQGPTKFTVIIDGQRGPDFDEMGHNGRVFFSPDSQHAAYIAKIKGQGFRLIADSKPVGDAYETLDYPLYSPDSKHLAYCARQDDKSYVVLDGKPGPAYTAVTQFPVFSPDSQRLAYVARQAPATQPATTQPATTQAAAEIEDAFAIVDSKPLGPYKRVNAIVFSPDSQHVGFAGMHGKKVMVVRDGVEGRLYDGIADHCPIFSPDSAHIVYMARTDHKWCAVRDAAEGPPVDSGYGAPVFSPDSQQLGYLALRDGNAFAIIQGTEGPLFEKLAALTFSPDSKHYAYGGSRGNHEMIVRDGHLLPEHDGVSPPVFSPDSLHLAYCARDAEDTVLVFDSLIADVKFDGSSRDGKPVFDSPQHVHLLVYRNSDIFRLDVEWQDSK